MSNSNLPSGFSPRDLKAWTRYYVPASDGFAYRVGDVVKSAGGTDAAGVITVTQHPGSGAARGVIVAVDPGLPATGGMQPNGQRASVPAVKTRDFYVWVADDPTMKFTAVDDGLTAGNLVGANVGSFVNFTPGAAASANGSSTSALTSSTFGGAAGAGCLKVLQIAAGSSYGANAVWVVQFAQHELGSVAGPGGSSSFSGITGQPTDNPALSTALASKLSNALAWNGTVPALQSGVSPVGPFGSNAFVYTGAGGAVLDGQTYATGDLALWGVGGSSTFSKVPIGGAYLGVFANTGALPAASANVSSFACVGASTPYAFYQSNGSAWVQQITSAMVGVANGVAGLDGSGKVPTSQLPAAVQGALNYQGAWNASTNSPALASGAGTKGFYYTVSVAGATALDGISQWNAGDHAAFNGTTWEKLDGLASEVISVAGRTGAVALTSADLGDKGATGGVAPNGDTVQITANVTISVANANVVTYNGKVLEFTGNYTVTLAAGLPNDFGFAGMNTSGFTASIASDGTTQLQNGANATPGTATVTRAASASALFAVTQRSTNRNSYVVS